jgi:hypothetical protein
VIYGSTLLDAAGVNGKDGICMYVCMYMYIYIDALYLDKKFYNAGVNTGKHVQRLSYEIPS